ncbi:MULTISPECIES: GntR family transcriptional regulator [Streptomyces]|nr:UTRA domain-containing protein [Streptomyces uncialis]MCX4660538.1 UTRA domain-containing protein [Streptomyces uncialis]
MDQPLLGPARHGHRVRDGPPRPRPRPHGRVRHAVTGRSWLMGPELRRRGITRLARDGWGAGRSVWDGDVGERELVVEQLVVRVERAPVHVARVLGLEAGADVLARGRRFVLDGKPVLLASSYFPADLVAGSAITRDDTGPGGSYARLAELGHGPVRFREEIRSRMPTQDEAARLGLGSGTPVVLICRTAFGADGRAVEVNEMTLDSAAYVLEYDFEA